MTLTQEELTELLRRRRDLSGKDWPEICAAFYWRECLDYLDRLRKADYVFAFKPRDPEAIARSIIAAKEWEVASKGHI